jgi:hypothetical protein
MVNDLVGKVEEQKELDVCKRSIKEHCKVINNLTTKLIVLDDHVEDVQRKVFPQVVSQTDTLITQIAQVIQEICDIKGDDISSSNKYHNKDKLLETTDPTARREHNKHPKEDIDGRDDSYDDKNDNNKLFPPLPTYSPCNQEHCGTPPPQTLPRPT